MIFISLTRLRVRSIRFVPLFVAHAVRSVGQARKAPGFQSGALLADRSWTFWTMTAWDSQESMRAYMTTGSHKRAMPHLLDWCDEASVADWTQSETALPSWTEADRKMREVGRVSKVRHPSPQQASLSYRTPRTTATATIRRS
jgi:heme-degrading monooxygenase HmoA